MSKVIQVDKTFKWFTTADLSKYEDKYISIVQFETLETAMENPSVWIHKLSVDMSRKAFVLC